MTRPEAMGFARTAAVAPASGGRDHELFTAAYSFVNDDLAAVYGIDPPGTSELVPVDLDPAERVGLLTHGSFLAGGTGDPVVHRGKLIRERLLCQSLGGPPANLEELIAQYPDPDRLSNPACSACVAMVSSFACKQAPATRAPSASAGDGAIEGVASSNPSCRAQALHDLVCRACGPDTCARLHSFGERDCRTALERIPPREDPACDRCRARREQYETCAALGTAPCEPSDCPSRCLSVCEILWRAEQSAPAHREP